MAESEIGIFVGNLDHDATNQSLRIFFEEAGAVVTNIDLKIGFAFVYCRANESDIEEIIRVTNGQKFGTRSKPLTVERSKSAGDARLKEERRRESLIPTDTLFIVGLDPHHLDIRDLDRIFGEYGRVVNFEARQAYCFVQFSSVDEATAVLDAFNKQDVRGRTLTIEYGTKRLSSRQRERDDDRDRGNRGYLERRDSERERLRGSDRSDNDYLPAGPIDRRKPYDQHIPSLHVPAQQLYPQVQSMSPMSPNSIRPSPGEQIARELSRDRDIAEAYRRMREWEAYYLSLVAERDREREMSVHRLRGHEEWAAGHLQATLPSPGALSVHAAQGTAPGDGLGHHSAGPGRAEPGRLYSSLPVRVDERGRDRDRSRDRRELAAVDRARGRERDRDRDRDRTSRAWDQDSGLQHRARSATSRSRSRDGGDRREEDDVMDVLPVSRRRRDDSPASVAST